jgi:Glycosyltransferase family 17
MSRIFDAFLFDNELDMLECRLTEMDGQDVYRHVLVEATVTHRGAPKPLYYQENKDRFAAWADKIIAVTVTDLPDSRNPWDREFAQREECVRGLLAGGAGLDDVVLHGDVDEIPRWHGVLIAANAGAPMAFQQRHYMYAADWQYPATWWYGTIAAPLSQVSGFQELRAKRNLLPWTADAGWHFSWLGGLEEQRRKLGVHCHLEMTPAEHERIASGRALREGAHHGGEQMVPVEVDGTWPKYIRERRCPPSWFRPRGDSGASADGSRDDCAPPTVLPLSGA